MPEIYDIESVRKLQKEVEKDVWDFERLQKRIEEFVFEHRNLPPMFFETISSVSKKIPLTEKEVYWLQWNSDFMKDVIYNNLGSTILWAYVNGHSFSVRRLADMMGLYDSNIKYWTEKFEKYSIVVDKQLTIPERRREKKKEKILTVNPHLPNISTIIRSLIERKYSVAGMEKNLKAGIGMGSKNRKLRVKASFRKYYRKKTLERCGVKG